MKYKTDAYEVAEKNLDRIVYVQFKNGGHFTCVYRQLLEENGKMEKFKYNESLGLYEEQ